MPFTIARWLLLVLFSCLAPFSGLAQFGPLGIGNATGSEAPTGYAQPRLLLWLDGSSVQTSGSSVIAWNDKSGNDHHFLPDALANQPTYEATGGPASTPCVSFDGVDDRLVCSNFELTSGGYSIYFVVRSSDARYGIFSYSSPSQAREMLIFNDNGIQQQMHSQTRSSQVGNISNDSWQYGGIWWNNSGSLLWEYNRTSQASYEVSNNFANGLSLASSGTAVIGDIQNAVNGGYVAGDGLNGRIAEIIIWRGHLTRPIARMMRTYLWTKYGSLDGNPAAWDKFQGRSAGSGGEYYNPIAVGRDNGANGGQHCESRSNGLVLRVNPGQWTATRTYMCAGWVPDAGNSIVSTNLPAGVDARWNRVWEIGSTDDNNQTFRVGFDFGEGINGDIPQIADNFVLLRRTGNTGTFSIVTNIIEKSIVDDEVVFTVNGAEIDDGNRFYTIGTIDATASSLDGSLSRTWYAYQTGNWSNPLTWTLDGSAAPNYVNPNGAIPAVNDNIYIGPGRTVTVNVNGLQQSNLTVFGTLDVATATQPTFSAISGSGIIRCAGSGGIGNFPLGNSASFADPNNGGLTQFYGAGGFTISSDLNLNEVSINLNTNTSNITLAANLTHNGDFEIQRGRLTVNNSAEISRTLNSNGNVIVSSNGSVRVSTTATNRKHTWNISKNFLNNGGDVRFTNRTAADFTNPETQHFIEARFISGSENQLLLANGNTYLSRLVVNKGADMTYILTLSSNGANKFRLLGPCDFGNGNDPYLTESENPNSCAIVNGTLEIRENVFVPLQTGGGGNYNINETAMLWINGGKASKGAPDVGTTGNAQAIVPYGIIKVSAGILNAFCTSGITTRANGVLQVEGGIVTANQIRTSVFGPTNIGGIIITGGEVNVDGTLSGGVNGDYYTMSLTYPGNLFRMTGGILRVAGPSSRGLIFINSDPEQTSVSGGTVIAEIKNTNSNHRITSRAAFWNLEVRRPATSGSTPVFISGGTSDTEVIPDLPLYIENSLIIRGANSPVLRMVSASNVPIDLFIKGNMLIENGGVYDHDLNTTYFTGNSNSFLTLPSTVTQTFNNLEVNKSVSDRFVEIVSGNSTRALRTLGEFRLENGIFENNARNVSFHGDVSIKSVVGSETSTGTVFFEGPAAQTVNSSNGVFHNLRIINAFGVTLLNDDLEVRNLFTLSTGNFYLGKNALRVALPLGSISTGSNSSSKCIVTDGSASAGGLELPFKTQPQVSTYPVGVESGGIVKYVPAIIALNSGFIDDGYIRVVPVDDSLSTALSTGGPDLLDFYWKVFHREFDNIPNVSHQFQYNNLDIIGSESNFASGRVLSELPFTRSVDSLSVGDDHINTASNLIYYNGSEALGMSGPGTPLANADYTAGNHQRFTGAPKVYFSRSTVYEANWETPSNWRDLSLCPSCTGPYDYHSSSATAIATDYPKEGDIAYVGFDPSNLRPHIYSPPPGGIEASRVFFTQMQTPGGVPVSRFSGTSASDITVLRPGLSLTATSQIEKIGQISGEGSMILKGDINIESTDVGDFLAQDSSIVILQPSVSLTLSNTPASLPNLFVTSGNNGSNNITSTLSEDIVIEGNLEIAGNANLSLPGTASGDILVEGKLKLGKYQATTSGPELLFQGFGNTRRVEVFGDVVITGNAARIQVAAPNTTAPLVKHEFIAWKNIIQNAPSSTGLNFFTNSTQDQIVLTLRGTGQHEFINSGGNIPNLGRLILDKGSSIVSSFNFNGDVDINGQSDLPEKPVDLRNGLLVLNHPGIDITLSSGGGNFSIPSTAGLELSSGSLRINGLQTGLILDGLLRVNGGLFEIGDLAGENNFIEYSSGGSAKLEINGGTLSVGSQIRRGLTNTGGVLDYRQTGGAVILGKFDAPSLTRGVLEILNNASRFDHTGGTITFVRGLNSSDSPSLLLNPTVFNVGGNSEIIIGSADSPSGGAIQNFGIQSSIQLNQLTIDNTSGNNPKARIQVQNLALSGDLTIDAGATLECRNKNLTLNADVLNNGTLSSLTGTVFLQHPVLGTVSGTGDFQLYNLNRSGGTGSLTTIDAPLIIQNDYTQDGGTVDAGANSISVQGDATIDGNLMFTASSNGLVFNGTGTQLLSRSGPGLTEIGVVTIANSAGVDMTSGAGYEFFLDYNLRMSSGVLDLKGNLLVLGENCAITELNPFGDNNMINTGGAFTNFGVKKFIPANSTSDVFIPLGIDVYMPARLNFSEPGFSSGSTVSNYLFRLNIPEHPVIVADSEAPDPEIDDLQNVLGMYFSMDAENVGAGFEMIAEFQYNENYIRLANGNVEEDYIGARIVDGSPQPSIFKFPLAVDAVNNVIRFEFDNPDDQTIDGDYFAGVENAIPDLVPVYQTTRNGDVDEGTAVTGVYDTGVPGNGAPRGAVVVIRNTDELTLNIDGVNFYKTIIEEDATLIIDQTSLHRLGTIEGTGTIRLIGTGNLPAGNYNQFFTCSGGKLWYESLGSSFEILANLPIVRNVTVTGTGSVGVSNNDIQVCEDFVLNGPTLNLSSSSLLQIDQDFRVESGVLNVDRSDLIVLQNLEILGTSALDAGNSGTTRVDGNILHSGSYFDLGELGRETRIRGNFIKTSGTIAGGTGGAALIFDGSSPQFIEGNFQGTSNLIRTLEMDNPSGLILHNTVQIRDSLILTQGKIFTGVDSLVFLDNQGVDVIGASHTRFIDGPMNWSLGTGAAVSFPVGAGVNYRPLTLYERSASLIWTVEYSDTVATANSSVTSMEITDPIEIETISTQEYWRVNSNSVSASARIGLSWGDSSGVSSIQAEAQDLRVMVYDDPSWDNLGQDEFNFAAKTIGAASPVSFSERFFTLGSGSPLNPLPVTWLYFNGSTDGNYHTLSWATASELNNEVFILERSVDGIEWNTIATIQGAGVSTVERFYEFTDRSAPFGVSYYRLKQVDFNGDEEYNQQIIPLTREKLSKEKGLDFLLYPNPTVASEFGIIFDDGGAGEALLYITDLSGIELDKIEIMIGENGNSELIPCFYQAGVYLITVIKDGGIRTKPLVIAK